MDAIFIYLSLFSFNRRRRAKLVYCINSLFVYYYFLSVGGNEPSILPQLSSTTLHSGEGKTFKDISDGDVNDDMTYNDMICHHINHNQLEETYGKFGWKGVSGVND